MRGSGDPEVQMFAMVALEDLIPRRHPIRRIRPIVDDILASLDDVFDEMYAVGGRPSVPPEQLLKGTVLMMLYSIRSERQFCERLNYDLLFKWFMDVPVDARSFDPTTFSKNRERLLEHDVAGRFLAASIDYARLRDYASSEHFSVDGTMLEAWASHKSFKPDNPDPDSHNGSGGGGEAVQRQGRNAEADYKQQQRSNATHTSTTDPQARLYRKSNNTAAVLAYLGHIVIEHRNGLIVGCELTHADGYAERDTAIKMMERLPASGGRRRTIAADKAYDTKDFVARCRQLRFTPHVAKNEHARKRSSIDGRTTRHPGYTVSQPRLWRVSG